MKSLLESIFDKDLVTKEIEIKGVPIDGATWGKCEEFFKSLSSKNPKVVHEDNKLLYEGKDCIIFVYEDNGIDDRWLYVVSPETVYMQYMSIKHNYPQLINIDHLSDYAKKLEGKGVLGISDLYFAKKIGSPIGGVSFWYHLSGCSSIPSRSQGIGKKSLCRAYLPETISDKAKKIIENYK